MLNDSNSNDNNNYWNDYLDHIGLWFIFTACAGISLIVWAFNWVCWLNQCCCCDFLHNPINKRIAWWMSFSFLLGILACCISAFVSVNRFGFALEGAWCAVDRVYYDSLNGTLKKQDPKWEGISKVVNINNSLSSFLSFIQGENKNDLKDTLLPPTKNWRITDPYDLYIFSDSDDIESNKICLIRFTKVINAFQRLSNPNFQSEFEKLNFIEDKNKFGKIKGEFLDEFDYYAKTLKACMKVLAMIYYCLLLIVITAAGVSMMFYACLKRQGYLLTFMKVLWNIIRFFMFSFFLYGTAYGIGFLALRDAVAYIMYVFNDNLYQTNPDNVKLISNGTNFFQFCLNNTGSNNLKVKYDEVFANSFEDFFTNYKLLNESDCVYGEIRDNLRIFYKDKITEDNLKKQFKYLYDEAGREGGIFGSFDCSFIKSDLNILYTALYDASVESRNLAALSLSASFFGAVAVYFYLLVMHHYNNDLFFDSGKSIFKGFDGFGGGYHKKNKNQDPAYKKRKLRAELELTSKNDEQSNNNREYKDVNKNDEED